MEATFRIQEKTGKLQFTYSDPNFLVACQLNVMSVTDVPALRSSLSSFKPCIYPNYACFTSADFPVPFSKKLSVLTDLSCSVGDFFNRLLYTLFRFACLALASPAPLPFIVSVLQGP